MALTPQQSLRIAMVAREAWSVRRLAQALKTNDSAGLIAPPLMGRAVFFVVEANATLSVLVPGWVPTGVMRNDGLVAKSLRAHMKLDEENDGRPGLLATLRQCEAKSTAWFQRPHRGFFGRFKGWLQPDMGLYFVNDDMFSTTHLVLAAVSLGELDVLDAHPEPFTQIGPKAHDYFREVGAFAKFVTDAGPAFDEAPKPPPSFVTSFSDCKASDLYADLAKAAGIAREDAAGFLAAIAHANAAHVVLPALLPGDSDFLLRQRALTAFYAARRVILLNADCKPGSFVRHLSEVLAARGGRDLRKAVTPKFRGDLAHYGVDTFRLPAEGPHPTSLRAALAHHRTSAVELDEIANAVLAVISEQCRPLLAGKYRRTPS